MTTLLEIPEFISQVREEPKPTVEVRHAGRWLIFEYAPAALFALKSSRATSTAGKTLLTPTPYAAKMAFVDAALRHGLTNDPEGLVRHLAGASLRIGVPRHACVTGAIQSIRQEIRDERKRNPELPPYRASIAMREVVHHEGTIRLAFDSRSCPPEFMALLRQAAPAINYFGKRGSFVQYLGSVRQKTLDPSYTQPIDEQDAGPPQGQRVALDDFGAKATFAALNSFAASQMRRNIDRRFVETNVPLIMFNSGPGFSHYSVR